MVLLSLPGLRTYTCTYALSPFSGYNGSKNGQAGRWTSFTGLPRIHPVSTDLITSRFSKRPKCLPVILVDFCSVKRAPSLFFLSKDLPTKWCWLQANPCASSNNVQQTATVFCGKLFHTDLAYVKRLDFMPPPRSTTSPICLKVYAFPVPAIRAKATRLSTTVREDRVRKAICPDHCYQ